MGVIILLSRKSIGMKNMDEKQKKDSVSPKQNAEKAKKLNLNIKDIGLNLDKMEYQQIVLSNSNFPESGHFKGNY